MSKVILVDNWDKKLGYGSLEEAHTGKGKRHRAFVTLLFNDKDQVLLQKRKHRLFDGFWDLTAVSHPLQINGKAESYQLASDRALKKEMGIRHVGVNKVGAFNYFAKDGKYCENEYCAILTGQYGGKFKENAKEVYGTKWVRYYDFIQDVSKNPSLYTPWARETVKIFKRNKPSEFLVELETFSREFSRYAKQFFKRKQKLVKKYPALVSRFYREIEDFSSGGKAMRPFLVYLGYKIAGGNDVNRILPICLAVELIHSFLLIHDDIIDRSNTRRGEQTMHKRFEKGRDAHYGLSQAIVAGDMAFLEAVELINSVDFSEKLKSACLRVLTSVILETAYGEVLDVDYSGQRAGSSEVWQVAQLKTAQYSFVGPLKIGAILTGVGDKQFQVLEEYGLSCGMAFQLKDDTLGVFGDEKTLGKSTLSDMVDGKNTILFYKTRELAKGRDKHDLLRIWGNEKSGTSDLERVRAIIDRSGARDWSQSEMLRLIKQAKQSIGKITKDRKLQNILAQCADFVIGRES